MWERIYLGISVIRNTCWSDHGQLRLVLRTPAETEAVRLIHHRQNKGRKKDDGASENRSHIADNGAGTELWVCRASFKV
jgi:hypothetical protein